MPRWVAMGNTRSNGRAASQAWWHELAGGQGSPKAAAGAGEEPGAGDSWLGMAHGSGRSPGRCFTVLGSFRVAAGGLGGAIGDALPRAGHTSFCYWKSISCADTSPSPRCHLLLPARQRQIPGVIKALRDDEPSRAQPSPPQRGSQPRGIACRRLSPTRSPRAPSALALRVGSCFSGGSSAPAPTRRGGEGRRGGAARCLAWRGLRPGAHR